MKLSKRDIGLLVILLGIVAFLVCYLAVYNPTIEKNEKLNSEISNLRPVLNELKEKEARKHEFEEGIANSKELIQGVRDGFPMSVRAEDFIMYAVVVQQLVGLDTGDMSFTQPALIVQLENVISPEGEVEFEAAGAYKAGANINAIMTYDHMKELVRHVYQRSIKTTIDSLTINYSADTGVLHGVVSIGKYFMTSESDPYIETQVPPMPTGVPNPFRSLDELPDPDAPEDAETEEVEE